MTNSNSTQATHTNANQVLDSNKTQAGSPKPDISKSKKQDEGKNIMINKLVLRSNFLISFVNVELSLKVAIALFSLVTSNEDEDLAVSVWDEVFAAGVEFEQTIKNYYEASFNCSGINNDGCQMIIAEIKVLVSLIKCGLGDAFLHGRCYFKEVNWRRYDKARYQ